MLELAYDKVLDSVDHAIETNSQIALGIYDHGCAAFADLVNEIRQPDIWHETATDFDHSLARSCVRAFFRDWSSEGATERDVSHTPILRALWHEFGDCAKKQNVQILVPGACLGRLVHSISGLGFSVEGNDISFHSLLARMYIFSLGITKQSPQPLYPWAVSFSNHVSRRHQFQRVLIPDTRPASNIHTSVSPNNEQEKQTVFTTGDFVNTYSNPTSLGAFSALTTCYFIDTAPNFLTYVTTAWNCLKPGGIWINIGPLLWNIEENGPAGNKEGDVDDQESGDHLTACVLELTAEEVLEVVKKKGFVIEDARCEEAVSPYVGNKESMLQYRYRMAFWIARKREVAEV